MNINLGMLLIGDREMNRYLEIQKISKFSNPKIFRLLELTCAKFHLLENDCPHRRRQIGHCSDRLSHPGSRCQQLEIHHCRLEPRPHPVQNQQLPFCGSRSTGCNQRGTKKRPYPTGARGDFNDASCPAFSHRQRLRGIPQAPAYGFLP